MSNNPHNYFFFSYVGMDQMDHTEEHEFSNFREALNYATYLEEHGAQMVHMFDPDDNEIDRSKLP